MSDRKTVLRYFHILNRLRKSPASFKEIDAYLETQSELQDEDFQLSKRQFSRVVKDINSIFELDIDYDASRDVYWINDETESDITSRRLEALDTFRALKIGKDTSRIVHFEKRHPQGTEYLMSLIQAIKKGVQIQFSYQKFWDSISTARTVEPCALKEFKNRWYLVAKDKKDEKIKTFGLDRISELRPTNLVFNQKEVFNVDAYFRDCFGIITDDAIEPVEIILSFDSVQGKYIKSLPLHESQEILSETDSELRLRVKLKPTWDFYQEILSLGELVRVISPPVIVQEVIKLHRTAIEKHRYEGIN
ncbi:helix-turn-helix transcriptional regulator [Sunxiuqinia sp. sy24]|uniref:helix-turn-helix transcriptional regulator n=1 Tax=Sunxiuqinia sp. sy24 TaxID=3461495 RepID=UPI004046659B